MRSFAFIGICILLMDCGELVKTQDSPPELIIDGNITSLPADGKSTVVIIARTERELSANQSITFTTTKGRLLPFPFSDFSEGLSEVTLRPQSKESKVLLQVGIEAEENVIITVTLNKFNVSKLLTFDVACPDQIFYKSLNRELVLENEEPVILTFDLLRDVGSVSEGVKVDFVAIPEDRANVTEIGFSDDEQAVETAIKPITAGSIIVQATISTEDCTELTKQIEFLVK